MTNSIHRAIGLLLAATLPAQAVTWRIPERGAVEYRRTWQGAASGEAKTPTAAKALAVDGKLPDKYLHRLAPAPWVCDGELDAARRALATPVRDLRDALRALACDLSGTAGTLHCPRLVPFGDVTIRGSWSRPGADGGQTLRATLSARPPAALAGEPRGAAERLRVFCVADADGTVELERHVDAATGLVTAWRGRADLVVVEAPKVCRRLVVADDWQFVAVRDNRDADFRKRVAAAIAGGVGWVREALGEARSFLGERNGDDRNYGSGRLALGLLTLVHGHTAADDPVLTRGFAELRRRKPDDSYSLATALMAFAARGGRDEADRKAAAKVLAELLQNVDPRVDRRDLLRFNYTAGPRYDTSLQQYGLLGLHAARQLGLDVPEGAFAAAGRHLLAVQGEGAGGLGLRLASPGDLHAIEGTDDPLRVAVRRARPRGFAYQERDEPPFGSMTCAGISGLVLARLGMAAQGKVDRALDAQMDDAVHDAFAWLASEFTLRANPGFAERADRHWYYWLYGLERSCALGGVALLQGRDWYYEGALQLLAQQQANGSFRPEASGSLVLDATCFAVLFLSQATAQAAVTQK